MLKRNVHVASVAAADDADAVLQKIVSILTQGAFTPTEFALPRQLHFSNVNV